VKAAHVQPESQVVPAEKPKDICPVPGGNIFPCGVLLRGCPTPILLYRWRSSGNGPPRIKSRNSSGSVQTGFSGQGQSRPVSTTRFMKTHVPISRLALPVGERPVRPRMNVWQVNGKPAPVAGVKSEPDTSGVQWSCGLWQFSHRPRGWIFLNGIRGS